MAASREYNACNTLAKRLYVEEKQSYVDLATVLPVTAATLREWGKQDEWDAEREKYDTSPVTIVRRLRRGLAAMASGEIDSKSSDAIHKLQKTIDSLIKESEEHFLARAVEVVDRQKAYFEQRFREDAEKRRMIGELLEEFLFMAEEASE